MDNSQLSSGNFVITRKLLEQIVDYFLIQIKYVDDKKIGAFWLFEFK